MKWIYALIVGVIMGLGAANAQSSLEPVQTFIDACIRTQQSEDAVADYARKNGYNEESAEIYRKNVLLRTKKYLPNTYRENFHRNNKEFIYMSSIKDEKFIRFDRKKMIFITYKTQILFNVDL